MKRILSFITCLLILSTSVVFADEKPIDKNEFNKPIEIEVLYSEHDIDFIEDIVLDDGSKVSDHEYIIKENLVAMRGFYPIADYFSYAAWITRDGMVSLSLEPKSNVRNNSQQKDQAWRVVSSESHGFASSSNWKNTKVMGWQFDCHYQFANSKPVWNLEPHRTASSYLEVVAKGCNP